jgi:hypothetical protein
VERKVGGYYRGQQPLLPPSLRRPRRTRPTGLGDVPMETFNDPHELVQEKVLNNTQLTTA